MSIPRSEYPRPELVRSDNWLNLNGQWQFAFDFGNSGRDRKLWDADDAVYTHEITVPFAPESKLSGIEYVDFIAACWYRRTVVLPEKWCVECGRILLHFGAVDYRSEVYVNGKRVGSHVGGYTPFTFDVTEYVVPGRTGSRSLRRTTAGILSSRRANRSTTATTIPAAPIRARRASGRRYGWNTCRRAM